MSAEPFARIGLETGQDPHVAPIRMVHQLDINATPNWITAFVEKIAAAPKWVKVAGALASIGAVALAAVHLLRPRRPNIIVNNYAIFNSPVYINSRVPIPSVEDIDDEPSGPAPTHAQLIEETNQFGQDDE